MKFLYSLIDSIGNILQLGYTILVTIITIIALWMAATLLNPSEEELKQQERTLRLNEETIRESNKPSKIWD